MQLFSLMQQSSMYTSWTIRYIGNDNSNTYLCLFGRLHLDLCLLELLESLPMCSTSLYNSEDLFLSCSWSKILSKYSYTTYHIELCMCVLQVHPFLSNDEMDKSIIFIFIDIIILDHIPHYFEESLLAFFSAAIYSSLVVLRETLRFLQYVGVRSTTNSIKVIITL